MTILQSMSEQIRKEYLDPVERKILREISNELDRHFKPYLDLEGWE